MFEMSDSADFLLDNHRDKVITKPFDGIFTTAGHSENLWEEYSSSESFPSAEAFCFDQ